MNKLNNKDFRSSKFKYKYPIDFHPHFFYLAPTRGRRAKGVVYPGAVAGGAQLGNCPF